MMMPLVVCLIDAYMGDQPLSSQTTVYMEGLPKTPVKKGGYFVFPKLEKGVYRIGVQSDIYFDDIREINMEDLHPKNPVVYFSLIPRPAYPFPEDTTLLRAALRDERDQPVKGAKVQADVLSQACARARLAQVKAEPGDTEISLTPLSGRIYVGERMSILPKEGEAKEGCQIAGVHESMRSFQLAQPLQHEQLRGALFLPVIEAISDERGEVVIPFGSYPVKQFDVHLHIHYQDQTQLKEVSCEEGQGRYLGVIDL